MGFGFGGIGGMIAKAIGGGGGSGSSSQAAQAILNGIAMDGYGMAMDMAGNNGQLLLIAEIGEENFKSAVNAYYADESPSEDTLSGATRHPEAIEEILSEVGGEMDGQVDEVRDVLNIVEKIEG